MNYEPLKACPDCGTLPLAEKWNNAVPGAISHIRIRCECGHKIEGDFNIHLHAHNAWNALVDKMQAKHDELG